MEERAALLARVSADHGTEIKDPATGEVIGRVAFGTPGDVAAAVGTAAKAQPGWAALDDQERCAALTRAAYAIDASAGNMPRLTLKLCGNDAAIVLPDVDPQAIAEGLFWGAFISNGQTCAAMKRLYLPDAIYDEVVDALAALAAKIPMGVGLDEGNVLGPLQNQMQWNVVNRLVEDAKVRCARVVMGGDPDAAAPGYFYPKTLIADIDNAAPLVQEERFGPACPSSGTPTWSRPSSGPTASTSGSARRCGPPTATRPSPSPRACRPGPCGSIATAASTRVSRSGGPSALDTACSSGSRD
jgi:acyl-CoA reductase-like NAD-dependent aldehyde dehydrogenase